MKEVGNEIALLKDKDKVLVIDWRTRKISVEGFRFTESKKY